MNSFSDLLLEVELMSDDNLPAVKLGHNSRGEWMAFVDGEPEIDWEDGCNE